MFHNTVSPGPTLTEIRALGKIHNNEMIICIYVNSGFVGFTSYGRNPELCKKARKTADDILQTIFDIPAEGEI